ncbi:MAG: MATE family efflux transporter [Actinomycetaceae bacterium]|nr:MATE family efflux transporter [Actinomycetaceae bacterium]MDY6082961.1 MATE family efflux transporter [Actinomycetaceae bacterium]
MTNTPTSGRRILSLALPALGSLLAEPLMVLGDSAMIGHVGTAALAGLTVASSVNVLITGMCIFLVYSTTAVAARKLGEGDQAGAVKTGVDGMWLGLIVGIILASAVFMLAPWIMSLFGTDQAVAREGIRYLRASSGSLVGMMWVLAGTGALRGQLDTKTPLIISVFGAIANVLFNAVFIFALHMGVAGAGVGTTLACTGMGLAFMGKVIRGARLSGVAMHPEFHGILGALGSGIPLMIRTATMQAVIMATVWVAASQGTVAAAGRQIANSTWSLTSNILDALAIAGQALVGFELGHGDETRVRGLVTTLTTWGVIAGLCIGLIQAPAAFFWPQLFSLDPDVVAGARIALWVAAAFMPLAGIVYMYDGILIGANDGWYLAVAGLVNMALYAPSLAAVWLWAPDGAAGLGWLWACYCGVFFLARFLTLGLRLRTNGWTHLS